LLPLKNEIRTDQIVLNDQLNQRIGLAQNALLAKLDQLEKQNKMAFEELDAKLAELGDTLTAYVTEAESFQADAAAGIATANDLLTQAVAKINAGADVSSEVTKLGQAVDALKAANTGTTAQHAALKAGIAALSTIGQPPAPPAEPAPPAASDTTPAAPDAPPAESTPVEAPTDQAPDQAPAQDAPASDATTDQPAQ